MLRKATAILERTIGALARGADVILVFMMLAICADVVMRYFLARPMEWVTETAEYSLLWITFLGAAWVLREEGHVKLDLVLNALNPRARALLNTITSVIGVMISLVIVWYSSEVVLDHFQRGVLTVTVQRIPKAPIMMVITVGSFLLSFQFARRAYGYLETWRALRSV